MKNFEAMQMKFITLHQKNKCLTYIRDGAIISLITNCCVIFEIEVARVISSGLDVADTREDL